MCGRYALEILRDHLDDVFGVAAPELAPRWEISPTQTAPVLIRGAGGARELVAMKWGLVPAWAKELRFGVKCINARSESVAEKPAFRDAWRRGRRCLVPASGFYVWTPGDGRLKQRHVLKRVDGAPIAFAGLWETWRPPEGEPVATFTILTTDASAPVRALHDRMPVIVQKESFEAWLDPAAPKEALAAVLSPSPDGLLQSAAL